MSLLPSLRMQREAGEQLLQRNKNGQSRAQHSPKEAGKGGESFHLWFVWFFISWFSLLF